MARQNYNVHRSQRGVCVCVCVCVCGVKRERGRKIDVIMIINLQLPTYNKGHKHKEDTNKGTISPSSQQKVLAVTFPSILICYSSTPSTLENR